MASLLLIYVLVVGLSQPSQADSNSSSPISPSPNVSTSFCTTTVCPNSLVSSSATASPNVSSSSNCSTIQSCPSTSLSVSPPTLPPATTTDLAVSSQSTPSTITTSVAPSTSASSSPTTDSSVSSQSIPSTITTSVAPSPSPSPSPTTDSSVSSQSTPMSTSTATMSPDSSMSDNATTIMPSPSKSVTPTSSSVKPETETKSVSLIVIFTNDWKNAFYNKLSKEYKDLESDLTVILTAIYIKVPGFQGILILVIRKGSIVCEFDVILSKSSKANSNELREKLLEASKNGTLKGFTLTSVQVREEKEPGKKEVLPVWALVLLIILGVIGLILLITVIVLAVMYKRSKRGAPLYNVTGEDWAHTYETLNMGDYKVRAAPYESRRPNVENGNHPTSQTNATYDNPDNGL